MASGLAVDVETVSDPGIAIVVLYKRVSRRGGRRIPLMSSFHRLERMSCNRSSESRVAPVKPCLKRI